MPLQIVRGSKQAPLDPLLRRTVAIIGYGNQGAAHALNLRDSGIEVVIGARGSRSGAARARQDGFPVMEVPDAVAATDLVVIALPDEVHASAFDEAIGGSLRPGVTVGFLHGFSVRFGQVHPPEGIGVVMVAPKGPGTTLRERFTQGLGIPCLLAVERESVGGDAETLALAWANGIGCARAGIIRTSFADEAETDLFGEQTVLCGGMMHLVIAAFEVMIEAGYPAELAYLECCHEVKQVADLVYEHGLAGMAERISNTAEFGAHDAGPRVIDDRVRDAMRRVLADIRSGDFAARLRKDHERGAPWFTAQRRTLSDHAIEPAGAAIRRLMRPPTS